MKKNRIYLRALEPDDYLISIQWRKDDEIWEMVGGPKYFVSQEYEKEWVLDAIHSKNKMVLAICLKENHKYIGNVILNEFDLLNRTACSAILLGDKEEWGKGFASEAIMQLLEYAFFHKNLHRVSALVLEENKASLRMHEKCGYVREGLLRQSVYKDGEYKNQVVLSILKEDFERRITI